MTYKYTFTKEIKHRLDKEGNEYKKMVSRYEQASRIAKEVFEACSIEGSYYHLTAAISRWGFEFCFYSKTKLSKVPFNGFNIPVDFFEETEITDPLIVDLTELEKCLDYLHIINKEPLTNIIWVKEGIPQYPSDTEFEEFRFTGLSNKEFPKAMGWIKDRI